MQNETKSVERAAYEAPAVVDYGTIDEVTKGSNLQAAGDFPLGGNVITSSAVE